MQLTACLYLWSVDLDENHFKLIKFTIDFMTKNCFNKRHERF